MYCNLLEPLAVFSKYKELDGVTVTGSLVDVANVVHKNTDFICITVVIYKNIYSTEVSDKGNRI